MALAQANGLPGSLEEAAILLGLVNQKDQAGHVLMLEMCNASKPLDQTKLERLYEYCLQDIRTEREIFQRLPPYTPTERKVWMIDQMINARGFATDRKLAEAACKIAAEAKKDLNARIATLTNSEITTANQSQRILKYIRERGHTAKSIGKRNVAQILAHNPDEETQQILELRRAGGRSSVAKFRSVITNADADGRVRDTFHYYGSHTGRWAGRSFQPQNLPKPTIADLNAATDAVESGDLARVRSLNGGDALSIISSVVRNVIIAKPGYVLIGADFSAIESRVLAWLAGERWKLDNYREFDRTGDPKLEPYCVTATRMLLREVTPADEAGRQQGKTADLALGFGGSVAAWRKFMPDDPRSDEQIKRQTVDPWRAAHPAIRKFWNGIEKLFKACARTGKPATYGKITAEMTDSVLRLKLPSGRCLVYRDASLGPGKFENSVDLHFHNGYQIKQAWFGTIVENIIQAVSRDLLACALVRLETAGFPVVLHCHDEAVCEIPEDQTDEARFLELMTTLPDWAEGLPIAAKTWISKRYGKAKAGAQNGNDDSQPVVTSGEPDELAAILDVDNHDDHDDHDDHDRKASNSSGGDEYPHGERRTGRRIATYLYRDHLLRNRTKVEKRRSSAGGRPQYPQSFWVQGRWVKQKPKGWIKVPFLLPEMLAALAKDSATDIYNPEGEKDCETLAALDLVATTNSEGATPLKAKIGKWTPELSRWFYGVQRLFILADNDEVGRVFANEKARALKDIVPDIRIVLFPDVPEGEDVTYWLKNLKHSKDELLARCEGIERWQGGGTLESICADQVTMRAIHWLWGKCFAVGKIGIIAGLPDEGKGQILCYIAARCRGLEWPNNEGICPQGNVIILSAKENPGDSLAPRLKAAGADLSRVHFINMVCDRDEKTGQERRRMFSLVSDLEKLRRKIIEVGNVVVVLIDPISAYLGIGAVDSYRDTDVRAVLGPLKDLAEELKVAVVTVMHFNKKVDITNALLRVSNSMAFVGLPRHAYGVINDADNGRKLFVRAKNNDAAEAQTLAFHFDVKEVGADPDSGEPINAPFIVWEPGYVDVTATEAMQAASENKSPGERDKAKNFLMTLLAEGREVFVDELKDTAEGHGIAWRTIRRAADDLKVVIGKERGTLKGKWFWKLP
jgi:DNA polymerase